LPPTERCSRGSSPKSIAGHASSLLNRPVKCGSVGRTEERGVGRYSCSRVVPVKRLDFTVLGWAGQALQVVLVAHCLRVVGRSLRYIASGSCVAPARMCQHARLEVTAANKQIDFLSTHALQVLHGAIYLVQVAVAAALHRHLPPHSSSTAHSLMHNKKGA